MSFDAYTDPMAEARLRSAVARRRDPPRRAVVVETLAAVVVLAAAVAMAAWLPAGRSLSLASLAIVVVVFLSAARVRFPVGTGWTRPTQIVFVPLLFLLPLTLAPFVVVGCLLVEASPRLIRREVSLTSMVSLLGDGTYVLGPVLVLALTGARPFGWSHWPVYVAAFAAQIGSDFLSYTSRGWYVEGGALFDRNILWTYATDLCLTCCGLFVAAAAVARPGLLLLALPLLALLGLFARERQERMESTLALSTAYRGTAMLLGDVIEGDDEYTGVHSREVVDLAVAVAQGLGLDATAQREVEFGALLHDVGKIRVPKEIIRKPGALDDAEWQIMRMHTVFGEEMLMRVGGTLGSVGRIVRASHERFDGTGYPDGLAGEAIPIQSRIVSTCDAFNAMTTDRPYRRAMSQREAITELVRCAGTHFDPQVVSGLLDAIDQPMAPETVPVNGLQGSPVAAG